MLNDSQVINFVLFGSLELSFSAKLSVPELIRAHNRAVGDKWFSGKVLIHGDIKFNELF